MVLFQRKPTHFGLLQPWVASDPFFSFQPYMMTFYVPNKVSDGEPPSSKMEEKKKLTEELQLEKSVAPSTLLYQTESAQVNENEHEYSLTMDIPGVKINDIQVEFDRGTLLITAVRKAGQQVTSAKFVQNFKLDEYLIDAVNIRATLVDGVLTVTAPKKAASVSVEIPILTEYPPGQESSTGNTSSEFRATLDLPGVRSADLKVLVDHGYLTIVGERHRGKAGTIKINKRYEFDIYTVDSAQFKAYLKDGVLTLIAARNKEEVVTSKVPIAVVHDIESAIATTDTTTNPDHKQEEDDKTSMDLIHDEDKKDLITKE